ncbi:PcfJ domain-containing protein [Oricola sp.]|uniref:PcfJ domain-containing protein n=1 Tax=Oricola sp. TaxID=1979950 RepID=UPI0025D74B47|nr:PcfJ domain-containing protein [Oricola sp.]MCI5076429.1 PcfJ domain-containing protein [Oricola sp.]
MARSMIKRRQEADRARIEAYEATLRTVSSEARPAPDFAQALKEAKRGFVNDIIRDSASWHPKMKTRNEARLRLAAARHLFARYTVPAPLERIWLDSDGLSEEEVRLRKSWYVIVARGGSLYKEGAKQWLTRKEVHCFLNPPGDLGFEEAVWHAVARSYTEDTGVALRIARSKVARGRRREFDFWREVARFFAVNPLPIEEIDDLCDLLADRRRRDAKFTLKGRTLGSLRRQMHEWHRDVAVIARIEAARRRAEAAALRTGARLDASRGGRWAGSQLTNWSWHPSAKDSRKPREEYAVTQLRSAEDLVFESRAMQHCVWTYASRCIAGRASIWSLRRTAEGATKRLLTIELDGQNRAVQIRGFANRLAHADERKVLERWGKARGVTLRC